MLERLLPRHMQIIYLINWLHLEQLAERPGRCDAGAVAAVSLIDETQEQARAHGAPRLPRLAQGQRRLGAAHRAHAQDRVPRPARALSGPHRQQDQRHHLPALAASGQPAPDATSSSRRSATGVLDDPDALRRLEPLADDAAFQDRFAAQRRANKEAPGAADRRAASGISVDPAALFDVQIKRIHEYKRQLLNILETIALYQAIQRRAATGLGAAREDLRRQGGGELRQREAHHQARQRRRPGRQRRSASCAAG